MLKGELQSGLELCLEQGRVADIRPLTGPVDLPGRALLPGFVNAHSHAFQRGLRGHVQWTDGQDDFWSWRERMYALANGLDPDGIEAVSALAFLEMAEAGFTTVGEFHYLQHMPDGRPYDDPDELARRVIRAARQVGLRICLLRVAYARAGAGKPPGPLQRRFVDRDADAVLDAVQRLGRIADPLVSVGLAPHSVRAVPLDWLQRFAAFEGPVHAHVSEQPGELEQCRAEHGCEPLELFQRAGLLDQRFTAVHMTWPRAGDRQRFLDSGAGVCVCPTTELDLGDGFYQVDQLQGVPVSIGTDSHAQIDPFAEVRALELHARASQGRRNVLSPPNEPDGLALRLLAAGTRGGARALGLDAGTIAVGRPADLVAVDLEHTALACSRPLPAIVFAGHPGVVRESWVAGEPVVAGGKHPRRREIIQRARQALDTISSGR